MSLNSSGLTPTAASTAVSAASGVWLRRVLLAVAAFETLIGLLDFYEFFDLHDAALSFGQFVINAQLFIHLLFNDRDPPLVSPAARRLVFAAGQSHNSDRSSRPIVLRLVG